MINNDEKKILTKKDILPSFLCLLGIIPGLACYSRLPANIPASFGIDNQVNSLAPKVIVVFFFPLLMIIYHLFICMVMNLLDNGNIPNTIKIIIRHFIPITVIIVEIITIMFVMNLFSNIGLVICVLEGIMLIALGNYIPKVQCFSFKKIKLPKVFTDDYLWHRFTRIVGWIFVLIGIAMTAFAFMNEFYICVLLIFFIILAPIICACILNKKSK